MTGTPGTSGSSCSRIRCPAARAVQPSSIPTSSDVIGPAISPPSESLLEVFEGTAPFDPADICSADSVQSVSPQPVNYPPLPQTFGGIPGLNGTSGMDGSCSGSTAGRASSRANAHCSPRPAACAAWASSS